MPLCGLRVTVETYQAPKGPIQCKNCQRFGHTKRNCGYLPRCVACVGQHVLDGKCTVAQDQKRNANYNSNYTPNYRGCSKWIVRRDTNSERVHAAKPKPQRPKRKHTSQPKAKKQPLLSLEQQTMGPGSSHVSKGGRIVTTSHKKAQQSETIAQAAKVTEVTPQTLSTKRSASQPNRVTNPLQRSWILPRTFPCLPSLLMS